MSESVLSRLLSISRAIAGAPEQEWYHNNLGYTLIDLGRFGEAVAPLEQATALDADQEVFWNNLGFETYLGSPTNNSVPAPCTVIQLPGGLPAGQQFTLQGIIEDDGAIHPIAAITNAVVIRTV